MEAAPAALPIELVEEILLRLPPDEPACLLRASLVCKAWGHAVSHRSFRRRLHELYPAPPVLGFLHHWDDDEISKFIPTTASSFSLPAPDSRSWRVLDCRHGRALFLSKVWGAPELLVCEPITGGERRVPLPPVFHGDYSSAHPRHWPGVAVFCTADVCDHRDCHGGPFQVVFVLNVLFGDDEYETLAGVYSSETGTWGEPTWVQANREMRFADYSSVLVRRSLLYFMSDEGFIVEYDLARHGMAVFDALETETDSHIEEPEILCLVLAEDGGMRLCQALHPHLKFWKREASDGPDARWVLSRVINLGSLLQTGVVLDEGTRVRMVGFAEGANAIFVDTVDGIFTIELRSEKVKKACDKNGFYSLIPVVGFYTPVSRGEHEDPSLWGSSEEACSEEGGEDKNEVEQPQQLFDKGSNAIEEDDFVSAGFRHALKTRVPSYKEVALECAITEYGCALGQKSQEVDNCLYDVPKSVPNEAVTRAANKDDAGSSKTLRAMLRMLLLLPGKVILKKKEQAVQNRPEV